MLNEIIVEDTKMEKELLYWLFSTIVQAFVALLALVGMVGIYWVSKLDDLFDRLCKSIEDRMKPFDNVFFFKYKDPPDIIDAINKIISEYEPKGVSLDSIERFKQVKHRLNSAFEEKEIFIRIFKSFFYKNIANISASLFFLGITTFIVKASYIFIGLIIAFVIVLSLWSLLEAFRLVKRAIMPRSLKKEIIE